MAAAIRKAPPVSSQPFALLIEWRVWAAGGAVMLVGVEPRLQTLRVTTPVQAFRPQSRTWTTASGRIYQTPAPPASDEQLCALLERFAQLHAGVDVVDVTEGYWREILAATQ